jgi:hypothetical protein
MKKHNLSDYEKESKKNGFHDVNISDQNEDRMLEIVKNPNTGMFHYFINSHSTGRKELTRSEAADYLK